MKPGFVGNTHLLACTRMLGLVFLLVAMLSGAYPASSASAMQSDPYSAELVDWDIAVSGPNYLLENVDLEEYPHGRGERIYITNVDSLGFVEVSFFDDSDTPEQTIDIVLSDFEAASQTLTVLARGNEGSTYYALARFALDDSQTGYFYIEVAEDLEGNVDLAQSIYSLNSDFLEQLEIAREEIDLSGLPFLNEPVIDLEELVAEDQTQLAATPEATPELQVGTFTFETGETELVVEAPIEFHSNFTNDELEIKFLSSEHGYGVVGFVHQDETSAEAVLESMFVDMAVGPEAPAELHVEHDDNHALGVYRVETDGEVRAMVISVSFVEDGLWKVEAMAATEDQFAQDYEGYQEGVTFDGAPFLADVDVQQVLSILEEN